MLGGKWRLDRKIGEGGMGTVYLAHDLELDRKVAIKLLAASLIHDADLLGRFEREAKLTAGLEHPNIVPVFSVGRAEGRPFMVMKYLEGSALSAFLRTRGVLQRDDVLSLTRQVAAGLDFIHSRGFIHRDIKTGNIFVSPAGHATILDFGILRPSRGAEAITRTGMVMGTPQYMAPEQALGIRDIDHRADLYALAVVVFECLTGKPPFEADNDLKLVQMQAHAVAPDVRSKAPWLPAATTEVMARALAKNPEHRYDTASDLALALEAAFGVRYMTGPGGVPALQPLSPLSASSGVVAYPIPLEAPADEVPSHSTPTSMERVSREPGIAGRRPSGERARPGAEAVQGEQGHPGPQGPGRRSSGEKSALAQALREEQGVVSNELIFMPAPPPRRRSRWPAAVAGVVLLAGLAAGTFLLLPNETVPSAEEVASVEAPALPTGESPVESDPDAVSSAAPVDAGAVAELEGAEELEGEGGIEPEVEVASLIGPVADAGAAEEPVAQAEPSTPVTTAISASGKSNPRSVRKAKTGKVNVITTFKGGPYWASILVNGKRQGTTPALLELPAGSHKVRIERTGFRAVEKQIRVASGGSAVLRIELIP